VINVASNDRDWLPQRTDLTGTHLDPNNHPVWSEALELLADRDVVDDISLRCTPASSRHADLVWIGDSNGHEFYSALRQPPGATLVSPAPAGLTAAAATLARQITAQAIDVTQPVRRYVLTTSAGAMSFDIKRICHSDSTLSPCWMIFGQKMPEHDATCDGGDNARSSATNAVKLPKLSHWITALRDRYQRLARGDHHRKIFAQLADMMILVDLHTLALVELNQAAHHALGLSPSDVQHLTLSDVLPELQVTEIFTRLTDNPRMQRTTTLRCRTGDVVHVDISVTVVRTHRPLLCIVARDTSERQQAEQLQHEDRRRLLHIALHDALTSLPNRRYLYSQLPFIIKQLSAEPDMRLCVIYVDIDHFKLINDTHGHKGGDEVLRSVAGRLRDAVQRTDVVLRIGGDEFVVVAATNHDDQGADRLARRLHAAIETPIAFDDCSINTSASMGIAMFPQDGYDIEELLRNADKALYKAKQSGRRCHCFFTDLMDIGGTSSDANSDNGHANGQTVRHDKSTLQASLA